MKIGLTYGKLMKIGLTYGKLMKIGLTYGKLMKIGSWMIFFWWIIHDKKTGY